MKKTLSILLVVLLATTSLFAGVNLKGRIGFGHTIGFDGTTTAGDYLGDGKAVNGGRFQVLVDSDYLTYSHGQAHGNPAMVTTAASRKMSYTVSGPRDPSGLALWFRRPSPVPFGS